MFKNSDFVHLHTHTEGSEFDCPSKVPNLVMKAREMGFPALAITDHGNVGNWIRFYKECKKTKDKKDKEIPYAPIKPILGMEAYFSLDRKEKNKNGQKGNFHLILLAQNQEGYENLCTLSQLAFLEGQYYHPRIDFELLAKYNKGIIASSACLSGVINRNLLAGRYDRAKRLATTFKDILGDNFYLAIFFHGLEAEAQIMPDILKLGNELDIMVAAEQDAHYLEQKDAETQNIVMLMSQKKCFKDPKAMKHVYPELYFKSANDMYKIFKTHPEVLYNTKNIAERVEDFLKIGGMRLPYFDTKPYLDENGKYSVKKTEEYYRNVKSGLIEPVYNRKNDFYESYEFMKQVLWYGFKELGWNKSQEHIDKVKKELADIKIAWEDNDMDFATYFLIVWDAINFAKSEKIPVGPGRGSCGASVVLRSMGITEIPDPLKYGTIFERFLQFDTQKVISKRDLGISVKDQNIHIEENSVNDFEELMEERELEEDLAGVDRWT